MIVEVLDREQAVAAGRDLLVRLTPVGTAAIGAEVRLSVDITGFRAAYGAGWSDRLRLKTLPAGCDRAVQARCAAQPLATTRTGDTLTAQVPVGGAATVVALSADTDSAAGAGDFSATSLQPSSTWTAGTSGGAFSWSYGLRVPPSLGGPGPGVTLNYNSQSVDGRTAATNSQPSWVGEGFDWDPGFIERRFISCSDDMSGSPNNTTKTGDMCWRGNNATMSLKGDSTELFYNASQGLWHGRSEEGSKIELKTGAVNGDGGDPGDTGEYWVLTSTDGTKYYFGLNRLQGWTAGKPETNSVQTVPVYGNHSTDPCNESAFADSDCMQAYRWNLDYVVDPHGNTMSLWWGRDANSYGERMSETTLRSYTRDAYLDRIDYGTHQRTLVNGVKTDTVFTAKPVPMRVDFTTGDRCLTNCTTHSDNWADTPWDLACTSSPCDNHSPSFWSSRRLQQIQTEIWDAGTTQMVPVERWTLTHSYPDPGDGTRAGMWLQKIAHAGVFGGGNVTVPDITFDPVMLPNRVDTALQNGLRPMNWARMAAITTETGGVIGVTYKPTECARGSLPTAHTNTKRCYPVRWAPEDLGGTPGQEITDWFHKYVVHEVAESDTVLQGAAASTSKVTRYEYIGGAAWRYAEDTAFTKDKYRTWNQWRGYETVQTYLGVGADQTRTDTRFFRGMHGDKASPTGGTDTVTVTDSKGLYAAAYPGQTVHDHDEFAGHTLETITYDSPAGSPLAGTVEKPWRSDPPTASQTVDGQTTYARFTNVSDSWAWTRLDGGRPDRVTRTAQEFDAIGMPVKVTDFGDLAETGDEQCTVTDYARNTSAYLMVHQSRVRRWALTCADALTPNRQFTAAEIIDEVRTSYDDQAWGAAPTIGEATRTEQLKDWVNNAFVPLTVQRTAYDDYGRVTELWDVDGKQTTTSYTPSADGPVTANTVVGPHGLITTTTTVQPAWGAVTAEVDTTNNRRTDVTYDAMGRVEKVWRPGRSKSLHANTPSSWFVYNLRNNAPSVVETRQLGPNGALISTFTFYDGLMRPRQTQSVKADGAVGALITDTFYNSAGREWREFGPYPVATAPSAVFSPHPASDFENIEVWTKTEYDGAGRPVELVQFTKLDELWRTSTRYPSGDRTETIPPAGGSTVSRVTDAKGRVTQLWQHHGASTASPYDLTTYDYDAKGRLATVVNAEPATWTYEYDIRGRQYRVTDPDEGVTVSTFDDAGRTLTITDGRVPAVTLHYTYDQHGRKTGLYQGSVTPANRRAKWEYDGLANAKGMLTSSTRYVGGESGAAYTSRITGLSAFGKPSQQTITIPSAEGDLLAGDYVYDFGYKANGEPATTRLPAIGDTARSLGWETLTTAYTATGKPYSLSTGATSWLVTGTTYTEYGELGVITLRDGTTNPQAQVGHYYDERTRRLSRTLVTRDTAPTVVSDLHFDYDDAGGITQIEEKSAVAGAETQCFAHDHLDRLREAWTLASGACGAVPTSTAVLGGAEKYWISWTVGAGGNRTQQVQHKSTGDVTTKYVYPATGSPQPHTMRRTTDGADATKGNYTYDAIGNTLCRPAGTSLNNCSTGAGSQMLTWDAEGKLATLADSTGTTSFVYDADGNRLLRKDPAGTTLYLPGQEFRVNKTGDTVISCVRYYTWADKNIAQRVTDGSVTDRLTWMVADRQNTSNITIAATGTQAVAIRRQDPYGNPRGGTTGTWPSGLDRGYVGGTLDNTGLTHLGAREYDPTIGRFLTVDPLVDVEDPQQMNGYSYANNSPILSSDPDGLIPCDDDSCGGRVKVAMPILVDPPVCRRRCTPSYTRISRPRLDWKNINFASHDPAFAMRWFAHAADRIEDYLEHRTGWRRADHTIALAAVEVRIDGKLKTRMVAFVSSKRVNQDLIDALNDAGVIAYQAKPGTGATGKGHAEAAAAAFGADTRAQRQDLGGEIATVRAFVMSVKACKDGKCDQDANKFLRGRGRIKNGSFGFIGGRSLDTDEMDDIQDLMPDIERRPFKYVSKLISQGFGRGTGRGPQPLPAMADFDGISGD
ncbi:hypothetical protein CS0771_40700 [Catellatospora sp. IY07-71]|nr:hypothetical protein CS0771_40700 [Catellatospora sp. IY07-71]